MWIVEVDITLLGPVADNSILINVHLLAHRDAIDHAVSRVAQQIPGLGVWKIGVLQFDDGMTARHVLDGQPAKARGYARHDVVIELSQRRVSAAKPRPGDRHQVVAIVIAKTHHSAQRVGDAGYSL